MGALTYKAHVRGGRLMLNEPTELADGTELQLYVFNDDMTPQEREQFEAMIAESEAQYARGEHRDAFEVMDEIEAQLARSHHEPR